MMKKQDDNKMLKTLREIVSIGGNKQCFDCGQKGVTYVNMTIGSFVCTTCSGVLRGLTPPHRVKSISMATFLADEVDFVRCHGNDECAKTWLGLWDSKRVIKQDHREFMVDKYERKRYYLEPASPLKSITTSLANNQQSQHQPLSSSTNNLTSKTIQTPADNLAALKAITLTPPTSNNRQHRTHHLHNNSNNTSNNGSLANNNHHNTTNTNSNCIKFQQQFTSDDDDNNNNTTNFFNQTTTNHLNHKLNNNSTNHQLNNSININNNSNTNAINSNGTTAIGNGRTAAAINRKNNDINNKMNTSFGGALSDNQMNNNFTSGEDGFVADFGAAKVYNNGKMTNGNGVDPFANFADFENNKIYNAAEEVHKNNTNNNCSKINTSANNNTNNNGTNVQWNIWQQFQWPNTQPERNRWSLPMSTSSLSNNSLNSSGGTFNSNSSLNSTPSVDRYAALKDLDEQFRDVKTSDKPTVNGDAFAVEGTTIVNGGQNPVNPFKTVNPFQAQQQQQQLQQQQLQQQQQQNYQNWTIPEQPQNNNNNNNNNFMTNGFGSPLQNNGFTNGFYYNSNMTNGNIMQASPFGVTKAAFGNPFMAGGGTTNSNNPFL